MSELLLESKYSESSSSPIELRVGEILTVDREESREPRF